MASQLNNIRLKLEEKRRHIENEKRRMEVVMSKQRQKVGKAAFLQAVTKVKFVITLKKKKMMAITSRHVFHFWTPHYQRFSQIIFMASLMICFIYRRSDKDVNVFQEWIFLKERNRALNISHEVFSHGCLV